MTKKGAAVVAELETSIDKSTPYACKDGTEVDTTGSGRLYQQICKYRHETTKHQLEVTFAYLPAGVELQKGDKVALYGDIESKQEKKLEVKYKVTGRALSSVKRGSTTVASFG